MACALHMISVVIPTRNEEHNIAAFLAALHPEVELVVVDASDDGTDQVIMATRPAHTTVIRSRAGIARARQLGAEAARGRWIVFSDADVQFEPGYFSYLAQHISGDAFYGPKYSTAPYRRYSQLFNAGQWAFHRLGIPAASGSNMGLRREVFERVGGFRLDLPVNEDTELMMRVKRRGFQVDYIPELAVRSLDDRRLKRGVVLKTLHSLSRNSLLFVSGYIPIPRRWLSHDWGYWSIRDAHRAHFRDVSA